VIVVDDAAATRATLVPVYAAIGCAWDPATAGALAQVAANVDIGRIRTALATALISSRGDAGERTCAPRGNWRWRCASRRAAGRSAAKSS
jgi:hypothetical protein